MNSVKEKYSSDPGYWFEVVRKKFTIKEVWGCNCIERSGKFYAWEYFCLSRTKRLWE